jgi:homoserine dehydrogenase
MTIWEQDKLTLGSMDSFKCRFFVRVKGTDAAKVTATFGNVTILDAEADNETAFITESLSQKDFEEKSAGLDIINRIRMTF